MNILVTGANGQLGNEMRIIARESDDHYVFTDVNQVEGVETGFLDITDLEAVRKMVAAQRVDVIVNCAAYTNVDMAESNEELVEKLNAEAPENLAKVMKETNGFLVQISTDYVFGKEPCNVPCQEDQQGTPTGVYGMSKLHGEQKIQAIDQVGTPTYALDLAKAIETVLKDYADKKNEHDYDKTGIYHYSNEGVCSWFDFTKSIAEYNGTTACDVQPCHSDEFPSPVKRPFYSVLDKSKIKETFGIRIPYWTESLRQCIANIKNK